MQKASPFVLRAQDAAFLRIEHLSILAASSGGDKIPSVARALGCRLSSDLRQITLFFSSSEAHELCEHINNNHMIAAVFSLPSTAEALQLKGSDAIVERPTRSDVKLVASYRQAFVEHLAELGYAAAGVDALVACEPDELVAVTFTPSAAFSQTPGPKAGHAIEGTR